MAVRSVCLRWEVQETDQQFAKRNARVYISLICINTWPKRAICVLDGCVHHSNQVHVFESRVVEVAILFWPQNSFALVWGSRSCICMWEQLLYSNSAWLYLFVSTWCASSIDQVFSWSPAQHTYMHTYIHWCHTSVKLLVLYRVYLACSSWEIIKRVLN